LTTSYLQVIHGLIDWTMLDGDPADIGHRSCFIATNRSAGT
jgi:hypothetical protein